MPSPPETLEAACRERYLDLLKRSLTFTLWDAGDGSILEMPAGRPMYAVVNAVRRVGRLFRPQDRSVRERGEDWPALGLTMIGTTRLDNVQACVEDVLRRDVPGDLLEAGVWRGGVPILMRALLAVHGVSDRSVWAADSFEGLPVPDRRRYPADRGFNLSPFKALAVPLEEVKGNFARFHLLDDQVKFLKGWFRDTLPTAPISRLAVLRIDGDLYESTMDALVNLFPKVSSGGYVIIDDYTNAPPCRQAVDDFRHEHGIADELVVVDWSAVYWQKS